MIEVYDAGRMEYREALALQEKLLQLRKRGSIGDAVILVEHDHVYTRGRSSTEEDQPGRTDVPVVDIGRGGKITYHGPGQLVAYFIFRIQPDALGPFVSQLEDIMLKLSREQGIDAHRPTEERDANGLPLAGVWHTHGDIEEKLGAIGLQTSRDGDTILTMHGLALNVNTDLEYFRSIHNCGFTDRGVTSFEAILGNPVDMNAIKIAFMDAFNFVFETECVLSSYSTENTKF